MDFLKDLKPAPYLRPMLNLGCLLDISTGRYYVGEYGESILNGGLSHLTGVGGRGNTFKSTLMFFMMLRVLDRYGKSAAHVYDTEMSLTIARLNELAQTHMPNIAGHDLEAEQRISITDKTMYNGSEWYDMLKTSTVDRKKEIKADMGRTPFLGRDRKPIQYLYPLVVGLDSLSQFTSANVLRIQDDGDVGDSSRNVEALRDGGAKTQLIMELPTVTARNGIYMLLSAHVGDEFAMDPRSPPSKKLAFLKNKAKFKNTPEKFTFLMNNCWYCISASPLLDGDKKPEFPRNKDDDLKDDTDLMMVNVVNLRAKSGPTGMPMDIIVSQSDGVHVGLTEFNYIKKSRFGIDGNLQNYTLSLVPDIKLSRTVLRRKIDENPQLQRALEITSEMAQMADMWHDLPPGLMCQPRELYADLIAKGYDWSVLLATRGYWTHDNDKHPVPFLSTMDLLNMRAGTYKPYWYKEALK